MSEAHAIVSKTRLELAWSSTVSRIRLRLPIKTGFKEPEPSDSPQVAGPAALRIPDILLSIFQYLDSPALARSAQVCQLWSDIALDILWKHLPTSFPLLELYGLRPTKKRISGDNPTYFKEEWDFGIFGPHIPTKRQQRMYLPRVRSLQHNLYGAVRRHHKAGVKLSTLQRLSHIEIHLPNLQTLDFKIGSSSDDDYLGVIPFVMPTLKSLTLPPLSIIPQSGLPRVRQVIDAIYNTPGLSLEYLDVCGITMQDTTLIEALGNLVRQQTSLRHLGVQLSQTELFASTCNEWQEHPAISSLKIKYPSTVQTNDLSSWVLPLSRFRGLKALRLTTSRTGVGLEEKDITAIASVCPTLQQLRLTGFWTAPALLVSIAATFPWLDILDVSLCWDDSLGRTTGQAVWPQLTSTMPRFHQLKELYLRPEGDQGRWDVPTALEVSEARTLSRLIIALCPDEAELLLAPPDSLSIKGSYIRRPCTSLDVVEHAVLFMFRQGMLWSTRS